MIVLPLRGIRGRLGAGVLLGLLLAFLFLVALSVGSVDIPVSSLAPALFGGGTDADPLALYRTVLLELRLPRLLQVMLSGAVLAVSGAVLQGLLRNPLAEPTLLGISGGAALGAVLCLVLAGNALGGLLVPVAALGGALLFAVLVFRLATAGGRTSVAALLLAGIALNTMAGAGVGLCIYLAPDAQLRSVTFWALGSFAGAEWSLLAPAGPALVAVLVFLLALAPRLNPLALGDREAFYLGVPVEGSKRLLLFAVCCGAGITVALAGVIGFVGLVVPHILRLVVGADHRFLLPLSALGGALLLLVADTLARTWMAPAEIPVGLLTSLAGGPFFLFLLRGSLGRETRRC